MKQIKILDLEKMEQIEGGKDQMTDREALNWGIAVGGVVVAATGAGLIVAVICLGVGLLSCSSSRG